MGWSRAILRYVSVGTLVSGLLVAFLSEPVGQLAKSLGLADPETVDRVLSCIAVAVAYQPFQIALLAVATFTTGVWLDKACGMLDGRYWRGIINLGQHCIAGAMAINHTRTEAWVDGPRYAAIAPKIESLLYSMAKAGYCTPARSNYRSEDEFYLSVERYLYSVGQFLVDKHRPEAKAKAEELSQPSRK